MEAKQMLDKFVIRTEIFAEQRPSGIYSPVRREITEKDIQEHLDGKRTISVYQVNKDNKVKWGVIDFDKPEQKEIADRVATSLVRKGFDIMLEDSGTEGHRHVWVFKECDAMEMIELLETVIAEFNLESGRDRQIKVNMTMAEQEIRQKENLKKVEIFPKTKMIKEGQVGYLVKLPFGYHLREKRWSKQLEVENV